MKELGHDEKSLASMTLGDVIRQTAQNYPDPRFRPRIFDQTSHYTIAGIDPAPFSIWVTADGVGTKPELAERLYTESLKQGSPTPEVFEGLAFDTMAMIDGDEARFGRSMVGVANIIDVSAAEDTAVINALAKGLKAACDEGRFALLNGETAELGYRTSGGGRTRVNWNAVGISFFTPDKLLLGEDLQPGQPIVAFREQSIRSNGLSKARAILEADYLFKQGVNSKEEYVEKQLAAKGVIFEANKTSGALTEIFGHDAIEQVLPPWHTLHPDITKQLLMPSRLYGPVMYEAQGKIDEPRSVDMIAAAHITGGGVPEKAKRMVEAKRLGVALDAVFSDPVAVTSLLEVVDTLPSHIQQKLGVDDRTACENWNRGVGFLVVTRDTGEAKKLVDIADKNNVESAIAGEITNRPEISWRGHTWSYAES